MNITDLHWHVRYSANITGDIPDATFYSPVEAADFAADELDHIADTKHEEAHALYVDEDWQASATAFVRCEAFGCLVVNLRRLVTNAAPDSDQRAPLYRDEERCGPKWMTSLEWVRSQITPDNAPNYFGLWPCFGHECRPGAWLVTDTHGNEWRYGADAFDDAWLRLSTVAREWADDMDENCDQGTYGAHVGAALADRLRDGGPHAHGSDARWIMLIETEDVDPAMFSIEFDRDATPDNSE